MVSRILREFNANPENQTNEIVIENVVLEMYFFSKCLS